MASGTTDLDLENASTHRELFKLFLLGSLADKQTVRGWLKGFDHELLLVGRVFTNKDGSSGRLSLVCSELTCDGERVADLHHNRWKVEDYHKSLNSNAALAQSVVVKVVVAST